MTSKLLHMKIYIKIKIFVAGKLNCELVFYIHLCIHLPVSNPVCY